MRFKLETYDLDRVDLVAELEHLPEFRERDKHGNLHLSHDRASNGVSVEIGDGNVYLTQHGDSRETDALLGFVVRRLLSLNDAVVIHSADSNKS